MNVDIPAETLEEIKAAIIRAGSSEFEPLLATPKQAAIMLNCQVRGLRRMGLPKIQLPGQRDKYAVADIHAAIAAGRVK